MSNQHFSNVISPAPRDVWEDLLTRDNHTLVTQTPSWVDAICATENYQDASRLYETADGRQLVLPLVSQSRWPAPLAISASFPNGWGMGGLIASDDIRVDDVAAMFADLKQNAGLRVVIRPNPLQAKVWADAAPSDVIVIPRVAHVLDLEGGFDKVWNERFRGTKRTAVRKAEKSGVEIECDSSGKLVSDFYDLWQRSIARWADQQNEPHWLARLRGQQRDPIQKFYSLAEHLGMAFKLWVARFQGEPVAAILVLQGANAHYTRGAMNQELAGPVRANDLLHRHAIEDACRAGCNFYHMGETGLSSALARFKEHLGAEAYPYAEYRLERLPITRVDQGLRGFVKRIIGFKDAG